jgi:hypothetical protein
MSCVFYQDGQERLTLLIMTNEHSLGDTQEVGGQEVDGETIGRCGSCNASRPRPTLQLSHYDDDLGDQSEDELT